ncbi:MAG: ATP-binding cassette domain-containing protein [Clostridia bacterium]|nr:ATP-binding cassette domain-containing protein [Clostridia bacterium]
MIELKAVSKTFETKEGNVNAVNNVSIKVEKGDIFGIIGLSGAGKSTLVRCINRLESPNSGEVLFEGVNLADLSNKELRNIRHSISMIFQGFNLLSQRTALKNICYPLEITGVPKQKAREKARELLKIVDLESKENAYPSQLSGGQKQRVAIARALATDPKVLLCDEATSALDPNTTTSILDLLAKINRELGVTIIIITHEMRVVEQICNKVAVLENGNLVEQGLVSDVFRSPKSSVAKELVLPRAKATEEIVKGKKIRLVFDGQSAFEPIISNLTIECGTAVNIIAADTKDISGKAVGQMLIQMPDETNAEERILSYLDRHSISYEVINDD